MADLRDIKRLRRLKLTCSSCGNVRWIMRPYVAGLWREINRTSNLPATWETVCVYKCFGRPKHFVDWPDELR